MSCVPTVFYVKIKLLLELTTQHKTFLFGFSVFAMVSMATEGGGVTMVAMELEAVDGHRGRE